MVVDLRGEPGFRHRLTLRHAGRLYMITVLHEQAETPASSARVRGEDLWIGAQDFEAATGWSMKPQGLCRGEICLPVPPDRAADYIDGELFNAAAFWRRLQHPVVHDAAGEVWVFGTSAADRGGALASPTAPDFALPDLAGATWTLSQHRGKKVLLATWASW
jgi:hypothetical protein